MQVSTAKSAAGVWWTAFTVFQQYRHRLLQFWECQHLTHSHTSQLVCSNMWYLVSQ